jgi:adenine-specific DNA-methyltransferase
MLLQSLIRLGNVKNNEIVLDFFAGAGTTAHAVIAQNAEDGGNRKFICVQMPEFCDEKSEAYKAGFKTIADIAKERIRRASEKIKKENGSKLNFENKKLDFGFKVFKLDDSNFKIWNGNVKDPEELEKQMLEFVDNVKKESTAENMLYELLLKSGLDPNVSVKKKKANGGSYYSVDGGKLIVHLEGKISKELVEKILKAKPEKMVCLDRAFSGNDQLKTNTALSMESAKIDFRVV